MRPLNRAAPAMPVGSYLTYAISSPADVTVKTACEQVGCVHWRAGWETHVDEATDLGGRQAAYIRTQSGRTFREARRADGVTVFRFESGQRCFREHQTRPETFFTRRGDWRQNLGIVRRHTRPTDWVEDFALHQGQLAQRLERG